MKADLNPRLSQLWRLLNPP